MHLQEVVDKEQPSPPVPVFLGGLSMGGMTAIIAAIRDQAKWQVPFLDHGIFVMLHLLVMSVAVLLTRTD